jgi:flagellar assembly protein FliH
MTVPLSKEIHFSRRPVEITLVPEPGTKRYTQEEFDLAIEQSRQAGFEQAVRTIQEEQGRAQQELHELQKSTLARISAQHGSLTAHFCEIFPGLVMQAVGRVLAGVEIDRQIVAGIVSEMLAEMHPGKGELEVSLCPRDLELLAGGEAPFRQKYPEIAFVADGELQPGDCVVRSRFGVFDGRLQTKLESLEALLD